MKKIGVFLLLGLLLVSFASCADSSDISGKLREDVEGLEEGVGKVEEFTEKEKWEYLGERWKNMLLKNKYVSRIDSFFNRISVVFFVLFGESYSLSLVLFFAIVFWVFFYYNFHAIFKDFSGLSEGIAVGVSFLLVVAFAHIGIYRFFSELLFKLIFYKEGIWKWVWFGILFLVLIILSSVAKMVSTEKAKSREEREKEKEKIHRKILEEEANRWRGIWRKLVGE